MGPAELPLEWTRDAGGGSPQRWQGQLSTHSCYTGTVSYSPRGDHATSVAIHLGCSGQVPISQPVLFYVQLRDHMDGLHWGLVRLPM